MELKKKFGIIAITVFVFVFAWRLNGKTAFAQDFSDAVDIQVNTPVGDSLEKARDQEQKYYRFSVAQSGSVSISFFNPLQRDSGQYWRVFLYNSEYQELFYMPVYGNKTSTVSLRCGVPEGIYYIKIESNAGWGDASSTDMYTFEADVEFSDTWEKEFNEEFTTATNIEINNDYSGTTRKAYDAENDYYKFQLDESGSLSVKFSNPLQSDSGHYWSVYLYNSQYQELCSMWVYGNKTSTNLVTTGLDSGTYYIKVNSSHGWGDAASTDIYSINAEFTPSQVWEKELNEDFTSATDIDMGTGYYGTIWSGHDYEKDFYNINILQSGLYAVALTTPNLNDDGEYWRMHLYDGAYKEIASKSIHGNKTYHAISQYLPSGTYYIKLESPSWKGAASTEPYMLKVSPTNTAGIQAACEHDYRSYGVDATYFSRGYTVYTCEKCGHSYKGDYSAKKVLSQGYLSYSCSSGKGKLYLAWSSVWDATGYQIRCSTDKTFKGNVITKNVKGQSNIRKTLSKLYRKKKYYVQVRAYVKSGSKTAYGKWSDKKMLKTK